MNTAAPAAPAAIRSIPLADIVPSPFQTRKDFDPEKLQKLAATIKQHGQLNPIIVRPVKNVIPGGRKPGIHVDVNMDPPLTTAEDDDNGLLRNTLSS